MKITKNQYYEMAYSILEDMNFTAIAMFMSFLDWTWATSFHDVPSRKEIYDALVKRLELVWQRIEETGGEEEVYTNSAGFVVRYSPSLDGLPSLRVSFVYEKEEWLDE